MVMEGFGLFGLGLFFVSFLLFIVHIMLCVWAFKDARRRGRSPEFALLVLLAILFFPILGLIVYLFIREL
ncbi:PLDc N-terminal domain-containing protein [Paenibacillus aurantiacus]|uniref:PLDc N-terminal domain-containing protein n=1 Tax=Paenibacillus aurantiacus TaxID=1936118 RepID=A0ABV5KUD4_9BACL